jgi:hypothetical protein
MTMTRRGVVVIVVFVVLAVTGAAATTTATGPTTAAPATTAAPPTAAPTTIPATEPPTASPTTAAPSTPTSATPSTTIAPASTTSSSSSTPWGWIIGIALGVLAIALLIVFIVRRRGATSTQHDWQSAARSALRDAELTRDMLQGEAKPDQPEDDARHAAVQTNVERVSSRFEQLAAQAPNDDSRRAAISVASSLRGYLFALEAERLLRAAPTPPTADQLLAADDARRARSSELDAALTDLRSAAGTAPAPN